MLHNNEKGFAVMNSDLSAYSFESTDLETCKRYCRRGYVVARRTPKWAGFSVKIMFYKWHKPLYIKRRYRQANILWMHINWSSEYLHKTGEIVFRAETL